LKRAEEYIARCASSSSQLASCAIREILSQLQKNLMPARVGALFGNFPAASAQLEKTLQSAHSHQLLALEFEAQLALAGLRKRAGQSVAARAESLSLENAARKNGFGLIVSKALFSRNAPNGIQ
jgi:hypothetical protein